MHSILRGVHAVMGVSEALARVHGGRTRWVFPVPDGWWCPVAWKDGD